MRNVHPARVLACSAGAVVVLVAVSACGSNGSKKPPSVTSGASSTSASGSARASASTSASPKPSTTAPKLVAKLPGNCDTLLPQPEIEDLIGVHFSGKNAFVVGIPEKNIGRLGNLNCRYGLGATGKTPALEIGISLYKSPAQADMRLTGTIDDYRGHGATQSAATVDGQDGTMLVGGGTGYNIPTLVVASDQRTVAVSMLPTVVAANKRGPAMAKVAALALDRTAP